MKLELSESITFSASTEVDKKVAAKSVVTIAKELNESASSTAWAYAGLVGQNIAVKPTFVTDVTSRGTVVFTLKLRTVSSTPCPEPYAATVSFFDWEYVTHWPDSLASDGHGPWNMMAALECP